MIIIHKANVSYPLIFNQNEPLSFNIVYLGVIILMNELIKKQFRNRYSRL
jgi:hypothetical protein